MFSLVLSASLCLFGAHSWAQDTKSEAPLTAELKLNVTHIEPHQNLTVELILRLPPGYKAYSDQFHLAVEKSGAKNRDQASPLKIGGLKVAPETEIFDKFSKKNRRMIGEGESKLSAVVELPADLNLLPNPVPLILTYQACTETYCLFPQTLEIDMPLPAPLRSANQNQNFNSGFGSSLSSLSIPWLGSNFDEVQKSGSALLIVFFVFLMGILTSFTPCIFPMIPITLSVLGKEAHARTRWQQLAAAHVYVLGLALTYAVLGLVAAASGKLFGSFLNHPAVLVVVCLVFLTMALSLLGLFELQAPRFLRDGMAGKYRASGLPGLFISGVISGLVASPCVGPVLVGILTYVAQTQDLLWGFALLFVYALGLSQLLLVIGMSTSATRWLPKSGMWLDRVKAGLGLTMLGAFFYYLSFLLPDRALDVVIGLVVIFVSSYLGALQAFTRLDLTGWQRMWRGLMLASFQVGVFFVLLGFFNLRPWLGGSSAAGVAVSPTSASSSHSKLNWIALTEESLAQSLASQKPVLIDFHADWCAACLELDEKTFSDPKVQEVLQNFQLLKFDATNESDEQTKWRKRFSLVGLPTLIFYSPKGEWLKGETLTEFESPEDFLKRLSRVSTFPQ